MPVQLAPLVILKKVAVVAAIVLAIIAIGYGIKLYSVYQTIKSQVNVKSAYPPPKSKDGRYLYKVNLIGADPTTRMLKIEAFLDGRENYEKTSKIHGEPYSGTWTAVDGGKTKIASGPKTDVLVFYYDMDGAFRATSYTKIDLTIDIEFKFETFFKDFFPVMSFTFDVPGPYEEKLAHFKDSWIHADSVVTEEDLEGWGISLTGE
ncbi:hypothetical protein C900_05786 [Fulvivirga imtechensis AK7]|uniref:Uncharacterized protein n=1 Tax=Fulvivirga imtechensis AK7 TaxID=1237149 RepID=L8JJ65_9BACT|nr:hypothetical protein [Fulvivirga imtechensis]ELR68840.1 hypothetical protein C900_05786 [Fulvivirga imtechensis AK7]